MKSRLTQVLGNKIQFKKKLYCWAGVLAPLAVIVFPTCMNPCNPAPITINIAAIPGVTVPAIEETPVTVITETSQYTGTIEWSPAVSGTFAASTVYTATITLTPKPGYTLQGVLENFFIVAGAAVVINAADSGVVTAVFPATAAGLITINIAAIPGVTVPAIGEIPAMVITETSQYTGTIEWSPAVNGTFAAVTQYTATIMLTALDGYTLQGVEVDFFTVEGATAANAANSGVVTAVFTATGPGITPIYDITIEDDGNGTATADQYCAEEGVTVIISAFPHNGFRFQEWQVVSGDAALSPDAATTPATFTMPGSDVTIKALFEELPPDTPNLSLSPVYFAVTFGYNAQPTATVTITNTGTGPATVTDIVFSGAHALLFALNGPTTIADIAANGGTADFTVQPEADLAAGTYTAVITVTYDGGKTAMTIITFTVNNAVVDIDVIPGVTPPALGGTPVTTITETAQYTGTVTWLPAVSGTFAAGTPYTAMITLTAKPNYTLQGVLENFFIVAGATSVTNSANSNVVTAVFPATDQNVKFAYYWVNELDEITVSSPGGATTISSGGTLVITANNQKNYLNHRWYVNGVEDTGQAGALSYTFSGAGREANKDYIITLIVALDGKYYNTIFTVRILP